MALHGKLVLNGADYSPFELYGVGVFMAFSGNGVYRNNAACSALAGNGPLPMGKYWIVERGSGGLYTRAKSAALKAWNSLKEGPAFGQEDWFALYKDDWGIDDGTWINDVHRGLFRLHPGENSNGCITIPHNTDYAQIRSALINTTRIQVPCMRSLMAYGWIEVISNGSKNCA